MEWRGRSSPVRCRLHRRGDGGGGMAIAGIVLGWVGVGLFGVVLVAGIAAGA
ncbi:hypothetical protein [Geodermatophilus sp. SYSU D00079]